MNRFFARRYALGGTMLLFLWLVFAWQFAKLAFEGLVGPQELFGLLRLCAAASVLFVPWFLWTWFTRLHVGADRITWRTFPTPRTFRFEDIQTIERVDQREPESVPCLAIAYEQGGDPRRVTMTSYTFPRADIEAFLVALRRQRPDLTLPEFSL
jgi:hypothetical protein